MNYQQTALKIVVILHFILTTWALLADGVLVKTSDNSHAIFLPPSYLYMNLAILLSGLLAIVHHESADSVFMYLALQLISLVQDIIFMAVYNGLAHNSFESGFTATSARNTYRFALGMAIVNFLVKPFTSFIIFRVYQDRGGITNDFIPGLPHFPSSPSAGGGGGFGRSSAYQDIDDGPGSAGGIGPHTSSGVGGGGQHNQQTPGYSPYSADGDKAPLTP